MNAEIEQIIRWIAAGIIILIEVIVLFNLFTNKSSKLQVLIKDMSAQEEIKDMSYSYSRSQLFWWTIIVLTCFAIDMAMTGASNGIMNSTALTLLGISAGTTVAGRVIDNSQSSDPSVEMHQDSKSQGFWMDILSDQNGVSIHRFQAVLFNIGFGVAFISQFISNIPDHITLGVAVPFADFDNTTLGLIGLSAGTYATLKFNENLSPARAESAPVVPPPPVKSTTSTETSTDKEA
jgi:hypothetical protein